MSICISELRIGGSRGVAIPRQYDTRILLYIYVCVCINYDLYLQVATLPRHVLDQFPAL